MSQGPDACGRRGCMKLVIVMVDNIRVFSARWTESGQTYGQSAATQIISTDVKVVELGWNGVLAKRTHLF